MPLHLKELCDAVIDSLESPPEDFELKIREVFCKMDGAYKATGLNDIKRAENLSYECRHILVILRLFPIEMQLAMSNLYKKTLWGFLSIYLDFKMMLIDSQPDKEAYFNKVLKEIFLLLGDGEKTNIWSVVVTSHTLNRIEILKLLAHQCIEATKTSNYEHEQYIRMIWVLHVFFSQCKRSGFKNEADRILKIALELKQPAGLCKWMCHHFPGFGWKGLTDDIVHETLVSEKQPKSFFKQVYQSIAKDDTLKFQLDDLGTNGTNEDDSSQCSESAGHTTVARVDSSSQKESNPSSKKDRTDSESSSDLDKTKKDKSKKVVATKAKTSSQEKSKPDTPEKSSKDSKYVEDSSKTDSSSKPTKTLGPGRSKPISHSAFLDDDDTLDNISGYNSDKDDESKQADKENLKNSDIQSEEDASSLKRKKALKTKPKKIVSLSDDEDSNSKDGESEVVSKRSNLNKKIPKKTAHLPSESETDVDEAKKETKLRVSKSVKRKVNDDSEDTDHTVAESDIDNNDGVQDEGRSSGRNNSRSKSAGKKPQPKKMRSDFSPKLSTQIETIADDEDDDKHQQSESEVLKKLPNADYEELQRIVSEYQNGPYSYVFEEFEEKKMVKGAEPFIDLSPLPPIYCDITKESTLADVLHNNKQKAKTQKSGPAKKKKSRRY